jgi:hypothetical protein
MNDDSQDSRKTPSQPPATSGPAKILGPLIEFLGENLKPIIASLAIGVASTIGVLLSPVKDVIQHHLWKEKASLLLSISTDHVQEGSSVALKLIVTPLSPRPLDPGVVTITFDHSFWTLSSGTLPFNSPAISSPVILPDKGSLELLAIKPGTTVVAVTLQTGYGSYRDEKRLDIDPVQVSANANRSNFTGAWALQIGNSHGKMEIRQSGNTDIAGSYYLDDGNKGVIDGWRDGISFGASFTRGGSVTKWIVEKASIAVTEGYVELKGSAYLARAEGNNWVRMQADVPFYATIKEQT